MNEQTGEKAFRLHETIKLNEEMRRALLMQNMQALTELKKGDLYQSILGDERAPWKAYLSQVEVFYTRNEVNTLIRIYDKFINELGISEQMLYKITRSRLFDMLPIVDHSNVEELLSMAGIMTTQDWNNEMRVRRGKTSIDECTHAFEAYKICKECAFKCHE